MENVAGRDGIVVCAPADAVFDLFEISSGFEVGVDAGVEFGPRGDGAVEAPDVDEVELSFGKSPRLGAVVDLEAEVRRDPVGLDGGDVCCDYLGVGVFVCEVDGLGRDVVSGEFDMEQDMI